MARMPDIEAEAKAALGWTEHAVSGMFRHHHAAEAAPQTPAPAPVNLAAATAAAAIKENRMSSFVTSVKNDLAAAAHDLAAHAVSFERDVLPALAAKLTALESNPVVDSLLNAVHVPPEALDIVVRTIEGLEALYNPQAAPAPVAPGQPQQPAPAQ